MREYNTETKRAILRHLASAESLRPGPAHVELWRLQKDARELSCIAAFLPNGVDVRMLEGGEMRRTQLVKDGPHAEGLAAGWKSKAQTTGWQMGEG